MPIDEAEHLRRNLVLDSRVFLSTWIDSFNRNDVSIQVFIDTLFHVFSEREIFRFVIKRLKDDLDMKGMK
jgi:hypothetical protein